MSFETPKGKEPVFRTPNPTELKEAAKKDPITADSDAPETDVIDTHESPKSIDDKDMEQGFPDSTDAADMQNSQVVRVNISGH